MLSSTPFPDTAISVLDRPSDLIEHRPLWPGRPIRVDLERIAGKPRQYMQMDMKNVLKSRLPISKEKVDPFTTQTRFPECLGNPLGDLEQVPADRLIQLSQRGQNAPGE